MTPTPDPLLEEVLSSFAVSESVPDPRVLGEWIQRYPQFERDLTRLAARLSTERAATPLSADEESAFVERGMQQLRAQLAKQAQPVDARPLAGLFAEATRQGYSSEALASKVGLSVTLLAMLDQRLFRFASIPAAVHAALSWALELPERTVEAFLQGPAAFPVGAAFKASQAPQLPEQVDFLEELALDPDLSADDRARWASLPE